MEGDHWEALYHRGKNDGNQLGRILAELLVVWIEALEQGLDDLDEVWL